MALKKLKIVVEDNNGEFSSQSEIITVLFNPNLITIQKTGWQLPSNNSTPAPSDNPAMLTVEFFMDTSAPNHGQRTDVRNYTKKIYNLVNPRGGNCPHPPMCQLVWGGEINTTNISRFEGSVLFKGVLQQVTKTLTHFTAEGMPVRATLNCTFLEYEKSEQKQKKLNPIDDPIRVIKQGETLSSIAIEEYGNPALWRIIADANRLKNPRELFPGAVLVVPPLPPQGGL